MAEIRCPMCGKPNPVELDICQFCEARLKPVTDELGRSQPPIRPGEQPTDIDTGQLESVLPQWLREIRQNAREPSENKAEQPAEPEEKSDLLGGLHSQSEGAEEIPDWLAGLRGEGSQSGFDQTSTDDDDTSALQSMLGKDAQIPKDSEESSLPSWLSDKSTQQAGPADTNEMPSFPMKDDTEGQDLRWDAGFETETGLPGDSAENEKPFDPDLPAWLQDTDKPRTEETGNELPAWLGAGESARDEDGTEPFIRERELPAWLQAKEETPIDETDAGLPAWLKTEKPAPISEDETTDKIDEGDLPTWLSSLGAEDAGGQGPSLDAEPPSTRSTTDWLASFKEEDVEAAVPQSADSAIKSTTDWLASLDEKTAEMDSQEEPAQPEAENQMPGWLSSLGEEGPAQISPQETGEPAAEGGLPGWLAALGAESSDLPQEVPPFVEREGPDWLPPLADQSATKAGEAQADLQGDLPRAEEVPAEIEKPAEKTGATPAFIDDEGKPISKEDLEAIFSMDMPDWLSDKQGVAEEAQPAEEAPQGDELHPADLPSWVQAMRPVESVISETPSVRAEEEPVEAHGPLAGLRGVLPATAGIGPISKPKGFSFKLQVSEDQQTSASILEKLLAEEINPKEVTSQKVVLTQRLLRLAITIVFLSIIAFIVFSGTRIIPISTSVSPDTKAVVDYVQNNLPSDAAVLMVFDYEAARAGELEAVAAPLVDQMLTLKAPRLSLVSAKPTGSGLAERFMKLLLSDRNDYVRNEKFINLGYLSGDAAGVQAFVRNPVTTKVLTTTGENAQSSPALQGVSQLSDFAAILLLTDDVETARIWIEQTEGVRGDAQLMVLSSAQSAPMILPYVRSGQVDGIVAGLESSAPLEQANSGRPGMARRYWDAYGFGLLTAVVMIVISSLWNLVSGWRSMRREQGEG